MYRAQEVEIEAPVRVEDAPLWWRAVSRSGRVGLTLALGAILWALGARWSALLAPWPAAFVWLRLRQVAEARLGAVVHGRLVARAREVEVEGRRFRVRRARFAFDGVELEGAWLAPSVHVAVGPEDAGRMVEALEVPDWGVLTLHAAGPLLGLRYVGPTLAVGSFIVTTFAVLVLQSGRLNAEALPVFVGGLVGAIAVGAALVWPRRLVIDRYGVRMRWLVLRRRWAWAAVSPIALDRGRVVLGGEAAYPLRIDGTPGSRGLLERHRLLGAASARWARLAEAWRHLP